MQGSEILNKVLEYTGLNAKTFSEAIGLERPQAIYDIQKGKTKAISQTMAIKIISVFPEFNKSWLLTGEGEMLQKKFVNEVTPIDEGEYMMVEYVDLRASAGRLGVGDVSQLPETHRRLIPKEFESGKFLVVGVDGDSMNDGTIRSLADGDEVLIYQHEGGILDPLPIKKTLFVITTRDGNVLKQIKEINAEEEYILCHSFNPAYEDFKIYFSDIYQVFIVCKVVNRQISLI